MKQYLKRIFIIGAICLPIIAYLLFTGKIFFNYPSDNEFPIKGIDISHHQGEIDWEKLSNEDISFIYMKATEGGDYKDSRYKENWDNAIKYNFPVGAYHFFTLCKPGKLQADNFISSVPKGKDLLPPVVDLEFGGNCKTDKTKLEIQTEIREYINIIEQHYGKTPILYATWSFYNSYIKNDFDNYPIWIRNIYYRPKLYNDKKWVIWQYRNRDHVNGINGYVDMNAFYGDSIEFKKLINGG